MPAYGELEGAWTKYNNSYKPYEGYLREIAGEDIEAHHFHIHQYGTHTELTFHILLRGDLILRKAHKLTDDIEQAILEQMNIEETIHVEPAEVQHEMTSIFVKSYWWLQVYLLSNL